MSTETTIMIISYNLKLQQDCRNKISMGELCQFPYYQNVVNMGFIVTNKNVNSVMDSAGYYNRKNKTICILTRLKSVWFHEISHAIDDVLYNPFISNQSYFYQDGDYAVNEIVAESCANTLMKDFGFFTGEYDCWSKDYIDMYKRFVKKEKYAEIEERISGILNYIEDFNNGIC